MKAIREVNDGNSTRKYSTSKWNARAVTSLVARFHSGNTSGSNRNKPWPAFRDLNVRHYRPFSHRLSLSVILTKSESAVRILLLPRAATDHITSWLNHNNLHPHFSPVFPQLARLPAGYLVSSLYYSFQHVSKRLVSPGHNSSRRRGRFTLRVCADPEWRRLKKWKKGDGSFWNETRDSSCNYVASACCTRLH